MARHTWETDFWNHEGLEGPADTDDGIDLGFWGEASDSDGDDDSHPSSPGRLLVNKLLDLHLCNKISAEDCCVSMHFAALSGIEDARPYALGPGSASGHYGRKLRNAMGFSRTADLYDMAVPGHFRHDLSRTVHTVSCLPAHEQLVDDLVNDPTCRYRLLEMFHDQALPQCYFENQIVKENPPGTVLPTAFYLDAVPFSQSDSVLGMWLINLISGRRFLFAVLRKSMVCRCGCKGYCSFHAMFTLVRWSLLSLKAGKFPVLRHDGQAWLPSDSEREKRAGKSMPMKAVCIYVKGDWSEYASTLGFPNWADGLRPCFQCCGFGDDLYVAANNTMDKLRWSVNEREDYYTACERCIIVVRVETAEQQREISARLRYDKRSRGCNGRILTAALERFGLQVDDRLEPSPECPDIGAFERLEVPLTVTFWRCANETITRHPNVLFDKDLCMYPSTVMTIDSLHCLNLGVMKTWVRIAIWVVLESGVFGGTGSAEERLHVACLALRASLMQFYKEWDRQHPGHELTRLSDFTPKMMGTSANPQLKSKGAETFGLLKFMLHTFALYKERLGEHWQRLKMAGESLDRIVSIWNEHGWLIPLSAQKVRHGKLAAYDRIRPAYCLVKSLPAEPAKASPEACWDDREGGSGSCDWGPRSQTRGPQTG
jgi:hypothetical protein